MSEREQEIEYVASLDRRITDHDGKIAKSDRDLTELSHEIQKLLERINNGLSPSVNKVRDENSEIKGQIKDLAHKMDLDMRDMKDMVRETTEHTRLMVDNFEKHRLTPVVNEVGLMKRTFVYGLVGALIVFLGNMGMSALRDRVFRDASHVEATK